MLPIGFVIKMPRRREDEGHQGYSNYETFTIAVEIDNDRNLSNYWRNRAKDIYEHEAYVSRSMSRWDSARIILADAMREHYDSEAPELEGVYGSLLAAALGEVDWLELAEEQLKTFPRPMGSWLD